MIKKYILSAALLAFSMTSAAQTVISFDTDDYKKISVYDQWS